MEVPVVKDSRLERILRKLLSKQDLINKESKGTIEIDFAGNDTTVRIKVVIQ